MSIGDQNFLSNPPSQPKQEASQITVRPQRNMGGFIADAVVEEIHEDSLVITEHPVEQGSVIADHAYRRPAQVRLIYAWSAGSPQADGDPQFIQTLYQELLDLKDSRVPFDIYTGKRFYQNMLIENLRTDSSRRTENSMIIVASCKEVLMATTQVVIVPPRDVQADPEKTASPIPMGTQQLQPAPNFNINDFPSLSSFSQAFGQ